jgi:hypothetical protein
LDVTTTFDGATSGRVGVGVGLVDVEEDDVLDELVALGVLGVGVIVTGVWSRPTPWLATWGYIGLVT